MGGWEPSGRRSAFPGARLSQALAVSQKLLGPWDPESQPWCGSRPRARDVMEFHIPSQGNRQLQSCRETGITAALVGEGPRGRHRDRAEVRKSSHGGPHRRVRGWWSVSSRCKSGSRAGRRLPGPF